VETQLSRMSFSVRDEESGLEYNGASLNTLFSQRRNLLSRRFHRMVRDILRFYREAPELLGGGDYELTLGDYVRERGYSEEFIRWHLFPMGAAVWSTGAEGIERFPALSLVEFFHNHGFLKVKARPQWRVLKNGSKSYLEPLTAPFRDDIRLGTPVTSIRRRATGVEIGSADGHRETFDSVVIAVHSDRALAMLSDPTEAEKEILGSIAYTSSETVLHTDSRLLPRRTLARASWNYHLPMREDNKPSVTYYMNSLQGLSAPLDFCVTLNRTEAIDPSRVIARMVYEHPCFNAAAVRAQRRKAEISGRNRTFYCGAYWGYGFHEDGVRSALDVCSHFGRSLPR
jgi:uncharacterized protein